MKASITPLLLAFSLVLGLTHSTTALADETQALIKERIDGFKASKKSVKTIAQAIEKQDNQVIIEQAELLYAFSDKIPSLYPENAKGGFFSKAKSNIWDHFSDFEQKAADFNQSAGELKTLAANNADTNELIQQLKRVEQSCQSCHKPYKKGL